MRAAEALSALFPERLPAVLDVELEDGTILQTRHDDYHGFHTRPFDWSAARAKFDSVTRNFTTPAERDAIATVVATLEQRPIADITSQLGGIQGKAAAAGP